MFRLNSRSVFELLSRAVYTSSELRNGIPFDAVRISGFVVDFAFEKNRLTSVRQDLIDLLNELPEEFHEPDGCMMTEAVHDRDGHVWTSVEDAHIDALFAVAGALGMAMYRNNPQYTGGYALRVKLDTTANEVTRFLH